MNGLNIKKKMDLSINNYEIQYKDLVELLIKQIKEQQELISEQKLRLANIQNILNAKVTISREGKIQSHESGE